MPLFIITIRDTNVAEIAIDAQDVTAARVHARKLEAAGQLTLEFHTGERRFFAARATAGQVRWYGKNVLTAVKEKA